jgi:hypothetical protein
MTTDAGGPAATGSALEDDVLIGDRRDDRDPQRELDRELGRELGQDMDRPSEPSGLPLGLCPFLATPSGAWRAAFPAHEHQCAAVEPPVNLALEKQRRLCLVADHETCATYRAALAERAPVAAGAIASTTVGGPGAARARGRPWAGRQIARTTPILLERPRLGLALPAAAARSLGQLVLVALVVIAFILIALARLGTPGSPAAAPVSPSAAAPFSPSQRPTERATEAPTEQPTARPSSQPSSVSSKPPG